MKGGGTVDAGIGRHGVIEASEAGVLTASIQYSVQESGLVSGAFYSNRAIWLDLGTGNRTSVQEELVERTFSDNLTHQIQDTHQGTLTASLFFNQGETGNFNLGSGVYASVPGPDTLGTALIGAVLLAFFLRKRLRQLS